MDPFVSWLLGRAGLQGSAYRPEAMKRRLPSCLRKLRVTSPHAARALLQSQPERIRSALSTVLVGVTEFFRDARVFDALREQILPPWLAGRPRVRVLGAGVATGQELYSIAMLLAEAGALNRSTLLGIDCRADAIETARAGWFSERELRGVEVRWLDKYFVRSSSGWLVRPELRKRMEWRTGDLFSFDDGAHWDLVLYRNVAIYFEAEHALQAWERLCGWLAPGGLLVTGKAERPPGWLPLARVATSVYRKTGE